MTIRKLGKIENLGVYKVEDGDQFYNSEDNTLSIPNELILMWAKEIKQAYLKYNTEKV